MPRIVFLWTDAVMLLLLLGGALYAWRVWRNPEARRPWRKAFREAPALCSALVLLAFGTVALLDSLHFRRALPAGEGQVQAYSPRAESVLDALLARQFEMREATYSRPLAWQGFAKQSLQVGGSTERGYPRLQHAGAHLSDPATQWAADVTRRALAGLAAGIAVALAIGAALAGALARAGQRSFAQSLRGLLRNETEMPVRAAWLTLAAMALLAGPVIALMGHYRVFGTDRTGNDVLLQALKSVRTAFVIGTLATIATLPLAIVFGVVAGYFRGWVDDLIQYVYTTLSSVPNVLLIAACVLMVQAFIDQHPELFETGAERADVRLLLLCLVLGLTGWASLCRLLRAETLKVRELEYVQAATAFGVGPLRIMARHILPNVMHLVLITTVLEFSALILYEAVLSYVGVGVDPSMNSYGGMINLARSEMSRDPVVWWSFAAAFGFMVTLVLAANLFADGVRDAFDPRSRSFRARVLPASGKAVP